MRRCWAQDSADRPDFPALKQTIRKINKWVISLHEFYANSVTLRFTGHEFLIKIKSTSTPETSRTWNLTAKLKQSFEQILMTHSLIKLKARVEAWALSAEIVTGKKCVYRPLEYR